MGMGNALADVYLADRAAGAEAAAARHRADANQANEALAHHVGHAEQLEVAARKWREHALDLENKLDQTTALASAGMIVINAVIKTMETMTPEQREKFRNHVAEAARARMHQLDSERRGNPRHVSLMGAFGPREQNKVLGIV